MKVYLTIILIAFFSISAIAQTENSFQVLSIPPKFIEVRAENPDTIIIEPDGEI